MESTDSDLLRAELLRIANTDECSLCVSIGKGIGPSHMGSSRCESGSLASGGIRSHCTCDSCF